MSRYMKESEAANILILLTVTIAVMGAPVENDAQATITNYEYRLTDDGYNFQYSTSNKITRREKGEYIRVANDENNIILRITGSYSYTDEKGELHEVNYRADENGSFFQKAGIPVVAPASASVSSPEEEIYKASPFGAKGISSAALASLSG